jgi:hypothetical protein
MTTRADQLHHLARSYVTEALGKGDFDAIPYTDDVTLRAPLCPGGSEVPLTGSANLGEQWWSPLPQRQRRRRRSVYVDCKSRP